MTEKKRVCIFISEDIHEQLKKLAKRERRSVSNLIEVLIAEKARES